MNVILWVLQIVLAIKFVSVTFTHGLTPDEAKMERGFERMGALTRPLLILTALVMLLGGVGLVLPFVAGALSWLVAWSAAGLALAMLLSVGFHITCRETPNVWVSLILFALAAFVAYGRWVLSPL